MMFIPSVSSDNHVAIPDWIKNNAGWWSDGQIDDNSFVSGIQWLISNGIIILESEANDQEDEEGRLAGGVLTGQNCDMEIDREKLRSNEQRDMARSQYQQQMAESKADIERARTIIEREQREKDRRATQQKGKDKES